MEEIEDAIAKDFEQRIRDQFMQWNQTTISTLLSISNTLFFPDLQVNENFNSWYQPKSNEPSVIQQILEFLIPEALRVSVSSENFFTTVKIFLKRFSCLFITFKMTKESKTRLKKYMTNNKNKKASIKKIENLGQELLFIFFTEIFRSNQILTSEIISVFTQLAPEIHDYQNNPKKHPFPQLKAVSIMQIVFNFLKTIRLNRSDVSTTDIIGFFNGLTGNQEGEYILSLLNLIDQWEKNPEKRKKENIEEWLKSTKIIPGRDSSEFPLF